MYKIHLLFSYGTLQLETVQVQTYGRLLKGSADRLSGFMLGEVEITDPVVLKKSGKAVHPIALKTGNRSDFVDGVVFEITEEELRQTDEYEVADYTRVAATFESGKTAWIYCQKYT